MNVCAGYLVTGTVNARLCRTSSGGLPCREVRAPPHLPRRRSDHANPYELGLRVYQENLSPLDFLVVQRRRGAHARDHTRVQSKAAGSWFSEEQLSRLKTDWR